MAGNKDQLPFATADGQTKVVTGGASGGHDFTIDPEDNAPKTGGGWPMKDRPQPMGSDSVNPDDAIDGGKPAFPTTKIPDQGTGSIGNAHRPFKVKGS